MGPRKDPPPPECVELFAQLSSYLDGDIPPEERNRLEEHLCGCPPCIEFLESLRRTVGLCHGFEPDAAPPPVASEFRQRLLEAFRKVRREAE